MVIRRQALKKESRVIQSMNWSLSGVPISDGVNVLGSARLCSKCGNEMAPYEDNSCASCGVSF